MSSLANQQRKLFDQLYPIQKVYQPAWEKVSLNVECMIDVDKRQNETSFPFLVSSTALRHFPLFSFICSLLTYFESIFNFLHVNSSLSICEQWLNFLIKRYTLSVGVGYFLFYSFFFQLFAEVAPPTTTTIPTTTTKQSHRKHKGLWYLIFQ